MRRSWSELALVCALVALVPTRAPAATETVEELVQRGLAHRRSHENEKALEVFEQAHAQSPSPRVRAQIGFAKQALGRWVEAEADLVAAIATGADPWIEKNRAVLDAALAEIRTHLGSLTVDVSPEGAEIVIDGATIGNAPLAAPARLVVGRHVILVRAPGRVAEHRDVEIAPATTTVARFALQPIVATGTPSPAAASKTVRAQPDAARPSSRTLAIGLVATGGLFVATGAYFGLRTLSLKDQRDQRCDGLLCDETGVDLDRRARTSGWLSTGAFAAGVVAGSIGIFLWTRAPGAPAIHASPTRGGVALSLETRW